MFQTITTTTTTSPPPTTSQILDSTSTTTLSSTFLLTPLQPGLLREDVIKIKKPFPIYEKFKKSGEGGREFNPTFFFTKGFVSDMLYL